MQKQWRTIWCLTGVVSLGWAGGRALGQETFEVPQYPQYVQYPEGAPPVVPAVPGARVTLTAAQIDSLLGLIALYPDPLLSLIFPAASFPQEVVAADQWLMGTSKPTEAAIAAQSWDASVKGLLHYPSVLTTMSNQIGWTQAVGAAFVNQPKDVLASVQRLRAEAQAARNLQSTPQQQVLTDNGAILIEPADPNELYVPQYDPNLVYNTGCPISYGEGYPIGLWCDNDFNWGGGYVENGGGWYNGWHHPGAWDQHRPAWDNRPSGWVAAPKAWVRTGSSAAPRLTSGVVAQLGLNQPHGATAGNRAAGGVRQRSVPLQIGRQPEAQQSRSAFDPNQSRAQVQGAVQRARPTFAQPAAVPRQSSPRPAANRPAQAQRAASPPVQRSAPSNVFRGGSGGAARAQSSRGHASSGRR
jgi:hypothetical protein